LVDQGFAIDIFTPAARIPAFTSKWEQGEIKFYPLDPFFLNKNEYRSQEIRKRLIKSAYSLLPAWNKLEKIWISKPDPNIVQVLREGNVKLAVITNPMHHYEQPIFSAAQALGIPTLGVIRSWDNLYKGLRIRPDTLAVWNPINSLEAIQLMKYSPSRVEIIGSTQFDPYFDPSGVLNRSQFCNKLNLDPNRPIITLATLGPFQHQYDETYLMDWLIDAIMTGLIPKDCQLVCRLHPASRLEQFLKYTNNNFVRLSWVEGYIPSLAWTMTKEDVFLVGNLLRHSDVVISPGSTITIETAIFDTPTIVPIFHTYQPELGKKQFDQHLSTHFRRLREMDLVPIVDNPQDLAQSINHALVDRTWYKEQRIQLVKDYVYFTDGNSTERLGSLIIRLALEKKR